MGPLLEKIKEMKNSYVLWPAVVKGKLSGFVKRKVAQLFFSGEDLPACL